MRGAAFAAAVWSLTAVFLGLQNGETLLFSWMVRSGRMPEWITATYLGPTTAVTGCTEPVAGASGAPTPAATDPSQLRQAWYATWSLGFDLGIAVGKNHSEGATAASAPAPEQVKLAETLGVPAPVRPATEHIANALDEFELYVETDPQCIAATLTNRFGPSYGSLYKFGAVVGHSAVYWLYGMGPTFVPQIRRYGQQAGVPSELWAPLTQASLPGPPGASARDKALTLVTALDEHMKTGQPAGRGP